MRNLVIMPTERKTLNLGEYAEEATIIVEETAKPSVTFFGSKYRFYHTGRTCKQMCCAYLG